MKYFSIIPEAQAIIHSRGVYRQVPIYERDRKIYAKHGGGFVRLSQGGATSAPNVRWSEVDPGHGSYDETQGNVIYLPPVGDVVTLEALK